MLIIYVPLLVDGPPLTLAELKSMIIGDKVANGFSLYSGIIDYSAPLTGWFYAFTDFVFGSSNLGRHVFSFVLIFLQAAILGIIFIDKKAFPESSFIPSLIFAILCIFSFDMLMLSGDLIALFFLLFALNNLYKEIEIREESFEMVLKAGLFLGIGSLFVFSYIIFVLASLVILLLYSRGSGRKFALLIVGFLLPHLVLIASFNINGTLPQLWNYFYLPNLAFTGYRYISWAQLFGLCIVPLCFIVAAWVLLNRESRFTKYQSQLLQIMFFWTIFAVIQVLYTKEFRPQVLITLAPSVAFFVSHFFLMMRRRLFAEMSFWIFLIGIVAMSYHARYNQQDSKYNDLVLNNGLKQDNIKLLVLADSIPLYAAHKQATPFLNWNLSKEILSEPDYYDNILTVSRAFQTDPPDVIIDPKNLMKPFLQKLPTLRRQYTRTAEGYRKATTSN
jgi:hypothetical protein